jgi:hypothetical protein
VKRFQSALAILAILLVIMLAGTVLTPSTTVAGGTPVVDGVYGHCNAGCNTPSGCAALAFFCIYDTRYNWSPELIW